MRRLIVVHGLAAVVAVFVYRFNSCQGRPLITARQRVVIRSGGPWNVTLQPASSCTFQFSSISHNFEDKICCTWIRYFTHKSLTIHNGLRTSSTQDVCLTCDCRCFFRTTNATKEITLDLYCIVNSLTIRLVKLIQYLKSKRFSF